MPATPTRNQPPPAPPLVDRERALDAFTRLVDAINSGRFRDASSPTRELRAEGFSVVWLSPPERKRA